MTSIPSRSCRASARSSPATATAYQYLVESIRRFPAQDELLTRIEQAGFERRAAIATSPAASPRCIPPGVFDGSSLALSPRERAPVPGALAMLGILRTGRDLARLLQIGFILARHDALFLFERMPVLLPILARSCACCAGATRIRLDPAGRAPRRRAAGARPQLHQARPAALDARRSARRASRRRSLAACRTGCRPSPAAARAPSSTPSSASRSTRCSAPSTTCRSPPPRSPRCISPCTIEGEEVAVKILRPGIAARLRARSRPLPLARPARRAVAAGAAPPEAGRGRRARSPRSVRIEMDLRLEAAAAAELAENFAGDPDFRVPRVDWQRTGAPRADDRSASAASASTTATRCSPPGIDLAAICCAKAAARSSTRCSATASSMPTMHPGNLFVDADGAHRGGRFRHHGPARPQDAAIISPTC